MKSVSGVGAAVLAGGLSSRMGANKALMRPEPSGPTVLEIVLGRLQEAGLPVPLLVTNTPNEYGFLNLPMFPDILPSMGPLGGILTALHHSSFDRTLVVACDMPFLSPGLLRYMAGWDGPGEALVPRWAGADGRVRVEPLHAIYSRSCYEPVLKRLLSGKRKASECLDDLRVNYLDAPELRRQDPTLSSFRNINTPGDWELLDSYLQP